METVRSDIWIVREQYAYGMQQTEHWNGEHVIGSATAESPLLTAIIPAAPLRTFPERLEQAVARILTGFPITASAIAREPKR